MAVILTEKKDHILYVTMNRPESLNALSSELWEALGQTWKDFDADEDAWVAILTGAGRAFCAGADLHEMAKRGGPGSPSRAPRQFSIQQSAAIGVTYKPIIAAINGYAIAGGWYLAENCDIRLASTEAKMGIAEVKWNLPAGWIVGLPKLIGLSHSMYLGLTALNIDSQRAYEMGFVQKVVEPDKLMEEATALAEHLCKMGQQALRIHKRIMLEAWNLDYMHAEKFAAGWMQPLMQSSDATEGAKAFSEGRPPAFKGT